MACLARIVTSEISVANIATASDAKAPSRAKVGDRLNCDRAWGLWILASSRSSLQMCRPLQDNPALVKMQFQHNPNLSLFLSLARLNNHQIFQMRVNPIIPTSRNTPMALPWMPETCANACRSPLSPIYNSFKDSSTRSCPWLTTTFSLTHPG